MAVFTLDKRKRIFQLECVRGLAALYVILHHTLQDQAAAVSPYLGFLLRFGQEAVILFFITSGFVIHYAAKRKPRQAIGSYFWDRAVRIYPIFLIALGLAYVCSSVVAGRLLDPNLPELMGNMLMLQDRDREGTLVFAYMNDSPLWSLSYEVFFYIAYALIVRAVPTRFQVSLVIAISLVGTAFTIVAPTTIARFMAYCLIWWTGVELCRYHLDKSDNRGFIACLSAVGLTAAFWAIYAFIGHNVATVDPLGSFPILEMRHFLFATLSVGVLLVWSRLNWFGFSKTLGVFSFLAPISYAIYVIHYPLMVTLTSGQPSKPGPMLWGITFIATLALGWLLEVPLQKAVTRRLKPSVRRLPDVA